MGTVQLMGRGASLLLKSQMTKVPIEYVMQHWHAARESVANQKLNLL